MYPETESNDFLKYIGKEVINLFEFGKPIKKKNIFDILDENIHYLCQRMLALLIEKKIICNIAGGYIMLVIDEVEVSDTLLEYFNYHPL